MAGSDIIFSQMDLLKYAESLIRESKLHESRPSGSNYSWLQTKHFINQISTEQDLEKFLPLIRKLTPENCAAVAVKLDSLTGASTGQILATFKKLLEEHDSMQLLAENVKRGKDNKNKKANKVHPVSVPNEGSPTVSFIMRH